jgi:hypothetical protein
MSAPELADARAQLGELQKNLAMYTVSATFEEAVALVIGYEVGLGTRCGANRIATTATSRSRASWCWR